MRPAEIPVERHNLEIQRNRAAWSRKPRLQEIYRGFYRKIAARIDLSLPGLVVELGSGMGTIKEIIPHCITTDIFPNPWLDRQENAYRLSFADESVSHLILFDVWHHLRYPGTALQEFRRVLRPGGRLILFEPAASWTGRWVYSIFHHEPVALGEKITWNAPAGFSPSDLDYYAAQGSATRIFWWQQQPSLLAGWTLRDSHPFPSFEYFGSGGFSGPQIGPAWFQPLLRFLDRTTTRWPRVFAARLLVTLEKDAPQ